MGSDEAANSSSGGGLGLSAGPSSSSSPYRPGNRKHVSSTAIRTSPTRGDWRSFDRGTAAGEHSSLNQPANDPEEGGEPIPKFDVDPNVPLERMALIGHASEESEGGDGGRTTGLIIGEH
jgi:hypothetical protein